MFLCLNINIYIYTSRDRDRDRDRGMLVIVDGVIYFYFGVWEKTKRSLNLST